MSINELVLLQQKVSLLRVEGKYKETIEACNTLLNYGLKLNDHKSILTAHIHNANAYYCIGEIEAAFNSIGEHKAYSDKFGDQADQLNSYNTLFLLYEYNKDYDKAKATLEKSIALGKELKHYNIVSNAYSNFSHICHIEENFKEALESAEIGVEMARLHQPATPILEFRVKLNVVNAQIELEDFLSSWSMMEKMIQDPLLDHYIREKAQCYDLQGRWYAKQKLYQQAYESMTVAKKVAESYGDVLLLKVIQKRLCDICEFLDDKQIGFAVQKEYISLLEEINRRELALTALKLDIKHSISTIKRKANIDYLTGLYNRRYLETTTNEWLKQAALKNEPIICIAFDIDNFKLLNDMYGHLFGDEVIRKISKTCTEVIKDTDLIGRYGGDEFVIVLKDISVEQGNKKAAQLLKEIQKLIIEKEGKFISPTVSIGVATNTEGIVMQFNELFHAADMALYKAKVNGKNQISII